MTTACDHPNCPLDACIELAYIKPKHSYWLTCKDFTVCIDTEGEDERIIDAPPILKKFIGQPIVNLRRWMRGIGDFQYVRYD